MSVEQPTSGFLDTVGRHADDFADPAGKGTGVMGCVAGGIALGAVTQGAGVEAGCLAGGLAFYPVGLALGYGTGAIVGTVRGTINLFADYDENIDTSALLAAIEKATPGIDLVNSMLMQSTRLSSISLVRSDEAVRTDDGAPTDMPETDLQLTLTISRLQLTTSTALPPTSRLFLVVRGELRDARTGQAIKGGKWRYKSERRYTADFATDEAAALRSEMAEGWSTLAGEIVLDLFDLERS